MRARNVVVAAVIAVLAGIQIGVAAQCEMALEGYCPVAYSAMGKAMKGKPEHTSQHGGQTYQFLNADAKAMFDQAPEKYLPAYGGYCATAMAKGEKLASDPKIFTVVNGRTFLFSSKQAKAMFDKDQGAVIAQADARWREIQRAAN